MSEITVSPVSVFWVVRNRLRYGHSDVSDILGKMQFRSSFGDFVVLSLGFGQD